MGPELINPASKEELPMMIFPSIQPPLPSPPSTLSSPPIDVPDSPSWQFAPVENQEKKKKPPPTSDAAAAVVNGAGEGFKTPVGEQYRIPVPTSVPPTRRPPAAEPVEMMPEWIDFDIPVIDLPVPELTTGEWWDWNDDNCDFSLSPSFTDVDVDFKFDNFFDPMFDDSHFS